MSIRSILLILPISLLLAAPLAGQGFVQRAPDRADATHRASYCTCAWTHLHGGHSIVFYQPVSVRLWAASPSWSARPFVTDRPWCVLHRHATAHDGIQRPSDSVLRTQPRAGYARLPRSVFSPAHAQQERSPILRMTNADLISTPRPYNGEAADETRREQADWRDRQDAYRAQNEPGAWERERQRTAESTSRQQRMEDDLERLRERASGTDRESPFERRRAVRPDSRTATPSPGLGNRGGTFPPSHVPATRGQARGRQQIAPAPAEIRRATRDASSVGRGMPSHHIEFRPMTHPSNRPAGHEEPTPGGQRVSQ